MIRIEIIANQSVYPELITNLEACLPDFLYTSIPLAYGRGRDSYKLGDSTWPETNFVLIAYANDSVEQKVAQVVRYIKLKFPTEGIKLFILHDKDAQINNPDACVGVVDYPPILGRGWRGN